MSLPNQPGPTRQARLTSPESRALASATGKRPLAILPIGSVEQHGPHLPLGVDIWLATAVADAAAEGQTDMVVCEPLPYGSSEHHRSFSGTMSLTPATFIAVLVDLCSGLWRDGYLPVMMNGHGGNRAAMQVAATTLGRDDILTAGFSYFDLISEEAATILPDAASGTGHACALETSLMMHLYACTVRTDRIPAGGTPEGWPDPHLYSGAPVNVWRRFETINPTGVIGIPSDASAERGAALFAVATEKTRAALREIHTRYA
jgi:creatinine amidohydrolase